MSSLSTNRQPGTHSQLAIHAKANDELHLNATRCDELSFSRHRSPREASGPESSTTPADGERERLEIRCLECPRAHHALEILQKTGSFKFAAHLPPQKSCVNGSTLKKARGGLSPLSAGNHGMHSCVARTS